jgi:hypothetical protein
MLRDFAIVIVTAAVVAGGFYLMGDREGPEAGPMRLAIR